MSMIGNFLRVSKAELDAYLEDSSLLENRIYEEEADEVDPGLMDIDKAWEGILFLLTGQNLESLDHPLGRVLFSGQIIDEEQDLGYGPGQYLTPAQVKEVNAQIAGISPEDLGKNYDPKKMTELEVYPNSWEEDMADYLTDYFKDIKDFYAEASKNDQAVITFLN